MHVTSNIKPLQNTPEISLWGKNVSTHSDFGHPRTEYSESKTYLPVPLDDRVIWAVSILINSMLPPVINIHIAKATHQQLRENRIHQDIFRIISEIMSLWKVSFGSAKLIQ